MLSISPNIDRDRSRADQRQSAAASIQSINVRVGVRAVRLGSLNQVIARVAARDMRQWLYQRPAGQRLRQICALRQRHPDMLG